LKFTYIFTSKNGCKKYFEACLNVINTALQNLMYWVRVLHVPIFHISRGLEATQAGVKLGMEGCTVLEPVDLANEAVSRGLASQEQA
jgi:hypothetical protein